MGENGSGKTTLLKHLNGLLKPSSGRVLVDSVDTRETTVATLSRKVGLVFQNPDSMFFCTSVEEEVMYALTMLGYDRAKARERCREVLQSFDLWHLREKSAFTLSGGEKKRLTIAIVMAWSPKYLVVDEPTSGQDREGKRRLLRLIEMIEDEGRAIILSSHDVEFIADLEPRVIVLSRGQIIADGHARDILTDGNLLERSSLLVPQIPSLLLELRRRCGVDIGYRYLGVEEAEMVLRNEFIPRIRSGEGTRP